MHEDEPQIRRVDESKVEERSLAHDVGMVALGAGATGVLQPLGHDLYDKAKDVAKDLIGPNDDSPEIILPPGTGDDE